MKCTNCGRTGFAPGARWCGKCGVMLAGALPVSAPKQVKKVNQQINWRWIAWIVGLLIVNIPFLKQELGVKPSAATPSAAPSPGTSDNTEPAFRVQSSKESFIPALEGLHPGAVDENKPATKETLMITLTDPDSLTVKRILFNRRVGQEGCDFPPISISRGDRDSYPSNPALPSHIRLGDALKFQVIDSDVLCGDSLQRVDIYTDRGGVSYNLGDEKVN